MRLQRLGERFHDAREVALAHVGHQFVDHLPLAEQRVGALLLRVGLECPDRVYDRRVFGLPSASTVIAHVESRPALTASPELGAVLASIIKSSRAAPLGSEASQLPRLVLTFSTRSPSPGRGV